jgi:hypothetical protein
MRLLSRSGWRRWVPLGCTAATSGWCGWELRANLDAVAYLNDSSMHEQMVRYATRTIQAGRLPLTGWYPYLNLGSPQFLHYQSLGAMLAGLVGTVTGPDTAFRWSLFLLLSLWPFAVYGSARVFGLGRPAAAAAAVLAPLVLGMPPIGYEQQAYLWLGYGVWAQLVASWALPFAWACSWRALHDRRWVWAAGLSIALTIGLHYETGYLAVLGLVVLAVAADGSWRRRAARTAVIGLVSGLAASWALVPLLVMSRWAAVNQVFADSKLTRGYGASQVVAWLVQGRIFDLGRLPVISLLVLAGLLVAEHHWRQQALPRALLCLFAACLLFNFGPTTWGPLINVIPGHTDIFFRRFVMGVQLAGIYLAGLGVASAGSLAAGWSRRAWRRAGAAPTVLPWLSAGTLVCVAAGLWLPAASLVARYDSSSATAISAQRRSQLQQGGQIAPLLAYIEGHGQGRTYAGLPTNWGAVFYVGQVTVYQYLSDQDIDEVGYTLRTASLMSVPENYFDEDNPADYRLFGVRYLLMPAGRLAPVPARFVMSRGRYSLWELPADGYVSVVQTVGSVKADRADVGTRTRGVLDGQMVDRYQDLAVIWPGRPAPRDLAAGRPGPGGPPGTVRTAQADLFDGRVGTTVAMSRPGTVLFSVSFDPGWQAEVDGRPAPTVMMAPALVGVPVGAGLHRVVLVYHGFGWYPGLAGVGVLALVLAAWAGRRRPRAATG